MSSVCLCSILVPVTSYSGRLHARRAISPPEAFTVEARVLGIFGGGTGGISVVGADRSINVGFYGGPVWKRGWNLSWKPILN